MPFSLSCDVVILFTAVKNLPSPVQTNILISVQISVLLLTEPMKKPTICSILKKSSFLLLLLPALTLFIGATSAAEGVGYNIERGGD